MALRDQPYIPLYVQDFLTDEKLAECSASATGVYIRLMCIMHKSECYGKTLLKQKDKQTDKQISNFALKLAKHLPYNLHEIEDGISELLDNEVLQIDGDFLIQKRMVKDFELSEKRSKSGSKGGKKTQKFAKEFAKAKSQASNKANIQANTEYENEDQFKEEVKGGMGEKTSDDPIPSNKETNSKKVKYADYVSMNEKEYQKLLDEHGKENTDKLISILNNYKGSKGKKYKSDYLAILSWVIDKFYGENGQQYKKPVTGNSGQTTGNNFRDTL